MATASPRPGAVFIKGLNSPFGMVLVGDDFYVADSDAILQFPYHAGDTKITVAGVKLADLPAGTINHHWTKDLIASPDGTKLYATVGSNSNVGENGIEAETNRAAVLEVDRASGEWRVFASGLRNPNGPSWQPQSGALWVTVNERDELGNDLVPDYMTSVKDGGFYGWPYSYYGQHVDTRVEPQRPDLVAKAIAPDYALGAHTASLGLTFNTGNLFPRDMAGGAFVGQHGSWNRKPRAGYKVIFVPFADGKPSGPPQDVLTGFLNADGEAQGRPVGVADRQAGRAAGGRRRRQRGLARDAGGEVGSKLAAIGMSDKAIQRNVARSRPGTTKQSRPKMLAQLQALRLVVRTDALAVHRIGPRQHFLVDQPADDLAVFENERQLARAHFQHRARALSAGAGIAEAGIEKSRVVHAEFADQRIERHHLGGIVRRHLHGFLGSEDVELAGIEDKAAVRPRRDRLPEFIDGIAAAAVDIDHAGVALGAVADEAVGVLAREIDAQRHAVDEIGIVGIDQPLASCSASSSSAERMASPVRKRTWLSRDPSRSSTGNVFGLISA